MKKRMGRPYILGLQVNAGPLSICSRWWTDMPSLPVFREGQLVKYLLCVLLGPLCWVLAGAGCGSTSMTHTESTGTTPPSAAHPPPAVELKATTDTLRTIPVPEDVAAGKVSSLPHTRYAVQIGAFKNPRNASAVQKRVREQLSQPALNDYDQARGFYRIRLGPFDSKESAQEFCKRLRRDFGQEYSDSWVVELQ
jgi:hypothetical protein